MICIVCERDNEAQCCGDEKAEVFCHSLAQRQNAGPLCRGFQRCGAFYIITIFIGFLFHANKRPICWGPCCSRGLRLARDNTHMGSKGFMSCTHTHVNIHTNTLPTNLIQPWTFFHPTFFPKTFL